MIYVAEITAAIDASGTLATFYHATDGFATTPADTPANTYVSARLKNPGNLRREMFSGNRVFGAVRAGFGEIVLINVDGGVDAYKDYGFDGQKIVLYACESEAVPAYPSGFTKVFELRMRDVVVSLSDLRIRLRDRLDELDKPLLQNIYGGTGGVDGVAARKGQRRPRQYGYAKWTTPTLVDNTILLYQFTDNALYGYSITNPPKVYDSGVEITYNGTDYTSEADMIANSPAVGQFRMYPAGGYVRLGSFAYSVTGYTPPVSYSGTGTVLKQVALDMGVATGDINSSDVTAADALATSGAIGWHAAGTDVTALQCMSEIAEVQGLWFGFDRLGSLRMGQLITPTGTAIYSFTLQNCTSVERGTPGDMAVPIWQLTYNYERNWTPNPRVAGSLSADVLYDRSQAWRQLIVSDSAIKDKHKAAEVLVRNAPTEYNTNTTTMTTEANRVLSLFKADRDLVKVKTQFALALLAVDLGSVVEVRINRFGFDAGKKFVVVAVQFDLSTGSAEYSLWG